MKCPTCGKEANGNFCLVCGTRLKNTTQAISSREMDIASLCNLLDRHLAVFAPMKDLYDRLAELQKSDSPGLATQYFNAGIDPSKETGCLVALRKVGRVFLIIYVVFYIILLLSASSSGRGGISQWAVLGAVIAVVGAFWLYRKGKNSAVKHRENRKNREKGEIVKQLSDHYRSQENIAVPFQYANPYAIAELRTIASKGRASSVDECIEVLQKELKNAQEIASAQSAADSARKAGLLKIALVAIATS